MPFLRPTRIALFIADVTLLAAFADAATFTPVTIPTTNNIQAELYSTFPTATLTANNALATPFTIPSAAGKCGPSGASPCNYYDGFGSAGNGKSIMINVSIANATDVYTLMNAYSPPAGVQLATITFVGTGGATLTYPLIGGQNIRDYRQGAFANTLTNTVTGVQAVNAFSCNDPSNCVSVAGGAVNVVADEQDFSLGATFAGQTLTQIIITDTHDGSTPILMGITVGSGSPVPPNLITNGGFEVPAITGTVLIVNSGSTEITGWTVTGTAPNTVGIVSGAYTTEGFKVPSQDGFQWLDLTGSGVSTDTRGIMQTVSTVAGTSYLLKFWVGNIYDSRPTSTPGGTFGTTSTVGVKINGTSAGSFTNSAQSTTMVWQQFSVTFTAAGSSTAIEFDNLDPSTDSSNGLDNVTLQAVTAPTITSGGIVPVYSSSTTIQPGSWASIYGGNLGAAPTTWNGNFPTMLGNTSVTIDGEAAYLWYVSPGQINLQAPDDLKTGVVNVTVTTPAGAATSTVTLGPFGPSLSLLDGKHIAGIIIRSDGSGAYGGGTYDILGPTGNSLGYPTIAAKAGDSLELFGVGFGPTSPPVAAGAPYSGAAMATNSVQFMINGIAVLPDFAGITEAGLFQFNIDHLPANLGTGDVSIQGVVAGIDSPAGAVISLQ